MRMRLVIPVLIFFVAGLAGRMHADDHKTNEVVDLSGEWTYATGYVSGHISLVQSNSHLGGSDRFLTDSLRHGKHDVEGTIDYPKVILIFKPSSTNGFYRTNEYRVLRWKGSEQYYLKDMSGYRMDMFRPNMK